MGDGSEAMNFFIYYRPIDGEIFGWSNSFDPQPMFDLEIAFVDPCVPDPAAQKYDVASGSIVNKTVVEKRLARMPTQRNCAEAVFRELQRTDVFMITDYPISDDDRHRWLNYRKMLRSLSQFTSAEEMIEAWQLPPDGVDSIIDLRERVKR